MYRIVRYNTFHREFVIINQSYYRPADPETDKVHVAAYELTTETKLVVGQSVKVKPLDGIPVAEVAGERWLRK